MGLGWKGEWDCMEGWHLVPHSQREAGLENTSICSLSYSSAHGMQSDLLSFERISFATS